MSKSIKSIAEKSLEDEFVKFVEAGKNNENLNMATGIMLGKAEMALHLNAIDIEMYLIFIDKINEIIRER